MNNTSLLVFDLGIAPYTPTQELMARLSAAVADETFPGVILLLEHTPVITLGKRGGTGDLLDMTAIRERGLDVVRSERGGQATLHAPGQLVSYPLVPIPRRDVRAFVYGLEETLRLLLDHLGVTARRRTGHPGLYVGDEKIASVGLRCRRWVSSHGTSLNVNLDLSLFDLIVSCGEPGLRQTSLQKLTGTDHSMDCVKALYLEAARQVFSWDLGPAQPLSHQHAAEILTVPTAGFEPATPGSGGQCSIP